ncbi:MAG: malate synthase A, partial [Acidobacteriota bacterium]
QIGKRLEELSISASDLLRVPVGTITEEGFRTNVRVGVRYMEAWLRGNGCVPLYGLMEDAATAEISRTQIWQWIHHPRGVLSDGRQVTLELFRDVLGEEMTRLEADLGSEKFRSGRYGMARQLFEEITSNQELEEFLTLHAYPYID